ncbi:MAG TPA: DUF6531 domain-containing protein, partial [bacterium]|nr:DUF6531 domain-containing protein [bacterium]
MKSILILTVLVILRGATLFSDVVAQEESSSAPKISTFATGKDILGVASNSVNLFSGDVHLPLALLSVPGRNGLDVGVNISYNSNIQNQNSTWNLEAPTGIMGLGWSFGYEKIIVNHKSTGSIRDDDYYHISGSAGNQLIRTGTAPDG